jgi:hypothetical protein
VNTDLPCSSGEQVRLVARRQEASGLKDHGFSVIEPEDAFAGLRQALDAQFSRSQQCAVLGGKNSPCLAGQEGAGFDPNGGAGWNLPVMLGRQGGGLFSQGQPVAGSASVRERVAVTGCAKNAGGVGRLARRPGRSMERLCKVSAGSRFEVDPLDRSLFDLPGDGRQGLQRVYGYGCGHNSF